MAVGFGGTAVVWIVIFASGGPPPLPGGLRPLVPVTGIGWLILAAVAIYVRSGPSGLRSRPAVLTLGAIVVVTAVLFYFAPH